jgi:hypothetical protein
MLKKKFYPKHKICKKWSNKKKYVLIFEKNNGFVLGKDTQIVDHVGSKMIILICLNKRWIKRW